MKLQAKHISALGLGITAIGAIVGILYYRNQAAASQAASSDTGSGDDFPYFQSAALPSSVSGSVSDSVTSAAATTTASTGSGVDPIDLTQLATIQADSANSASDNSLQASWLSTLESDTSGIIASLSGAGFGTTGLQSNVTEGANGGFTYTVGATGIVQNATGSASASPTIIAPAPATVVGQLPNIRLPDGTEINPNTGQVAEATPASASQGGG